MTETRFKDVDSAGDPGKHIGYLDVVGAMDVIAAWKGRSIEALGLRAGDRVLEVGCGNGDEARAMARRVAPNGEVTAIDISEQMIEEARRRGTDGVRFERMDAHDLRSADASFDACRCERTLQHVSDPARVVREMSRVVRPGRRIVLLEPDWETLLVSATDVALTRRIVDHQVELPGHPNGRIGRRLPSLLVEAGLRVIAAEGVLALVRDFAAADQIFTLTAVAHAARDAGVISADEATRWLADLSAQSKRGALVASLAGYTAVGEKPGS